MTGQPRFFEEYTTGQKGNTPNRTFTEADVAAFAYQTCDFSTPHFDRHFMATSIYGERVIHGLLGSCLASGMLSLHAPHAIGRGIPDAYLYGYEADFRRGIRFGDTCRIDWQVAEKEAASPAEGFGLVKTRFQIVTQDDAAATDGAFTILVRKKAAGQAGLRLNAPKMFQLEDYLPPTREPSYAEDYPVGKGRHTEGRTITETDIINFAGLTGDYNPQYTDVEFARKSPYGERIAQPMMVFSVAFRFWGQDRDLYFPWAKNKYAAGHLSDRAIFLAPVKIGDTISCIYRKTGGRVSSSKPEIGIVTHELQIVNQRNEVVQEVATTHMVASRAGLKS